MEHILIEHDPEITVVRETWLHELVLDDEIVPPGFKILRKDRGSRGGGVAIIVKRDLVCNLIENSSNIESVWCKVKLPNIEILIGAVYRPPGSGFDFIEKLNNFLIKTRANNHNFIIAGDLNVPGIDWDALTPGNQDVILASALIDMTFSHGLTQIVKDYTRDQSGCKSVLDLFFLSDSVMLYPFEYSVVPGISDHSMVTLSLHLENLPSTCCDVTTYKHFDYTDDVGILDKLESSYPGFTDLSLTPANDVNNLWLKFKKIVIECIDHYVPRRTKKGIETIRGSRKISYMKSKKSRDVESSCAKPILKPYV